MSVYYDFQNSEKSSIAVRQETYDAAEDVEPHMHAFYEFTLICRGCCKHSFRGVEVPLISGDVFLIPPHESHSYKISPGTVVLNCYFFPDRVGSYSSYIQENRLSLSVPTSLDDVKNQWDTLLATLSIRGDTDVEDPKMVTDNLTKQGILHLSPEIASEVETLLLRIADEHADLMYDSEYMKAAILQIVLVIFKRARFHYPQRIPRQPERKKQLIQNALIHIETHYMDHITIEDLAQTVSLSVSYFRSLFKEVTGMAPLDYLNRVRIIKSLEYLQYDDLPIAEAAARVGILDSNYFTRLFKRIVGYPPRYFKKISEGA